MLKHGEIGAAFYDAEIKFKRVQDHFIFLYEELRLYIFGKE